MRSVVMLLLLITLTGLTGLQGQAPTAPKLFSTLPSSYTGVTFRNDIYEDNNFFYYNYEYLYNGGGVAIGDINNDGLQDLYFSGSTSSNKLYLNLGNCQFKDITEQAGVKGGMGIKTGVNMFDINQDGKLDIIVSRSGPFEPSFREKIIYINNGDLTFTDKAKELGLNDASHTTQSYFLDYDRDGDMDMFLVNHSVDFANEMVVDAKMQNGKLVLIDDTARKYVSHRLFENRNGRFFDISRKAGISTNTFGLAAGVADINRDGWPDIYVANDFKKPDNLFINNQNGTFSDKLTSYFHHISQASMGFDIADINNDGLEDIFVLDMAYEDPYRQKTLFTQHLNYDKFQLAVQLGLFYQYNRNTLQLNNGDGTFSEAGYYAGLAETDWSWAPLIADFDNDGKKDLYVTNGYKRDVNNWDYRGFFVDSIKNLVAAGQPVDMLKWFSQIPSVPLKNYFFRNNGTLRFDNYTEQWADSPPCFSNGAAYADLDNDGDLDIVVNNIDGDAFVLRNNAEKMETGNYLRFRIFRNRESPQESYGTTVKLIHADKGIQLQHYDPQRGYMSSNEHFLHFGLGAEKIVPSVEITFPNGKQLMLKDVAADQILNVYESDGNTVEKVVASAPASFKEITAQKKFTYAHKEGEFIDFKREPLLPYKCSRKGPYYAYADVNADGREDVFVGSSSGSEPALLIQGTNGVFTKKAQASFLKDKGFEDGGAVFFDADGDKDMDLYVVSGGSEFNIGSPLYQDRLYLNDGKGTFTRATQAIPKESFNGSCVIPIDFDADGQMDLFVGGAVLPGKFPKHDGHMILQNKKGVFTNVTEKVAPGLSGLGIINNAAWRDIDGDKTPELIVAGEWMPVTIFGLQDGMLTRKNYSVELEDRGKTVRSTLDQVSGWWNVITVEDIDKDGDLDILAGNRGLNSKITASLYEPCTMYAKDFDGNGSYDAVLGYYIWGKCYPMYHRDQLIDQMPFMRKNFYRYRMYADKTLDQLFTEEQKKGMDTMKAASFASGIFFNDGNNHFRFERLPELAQLSTINDIVVEDLDRDGHKDLLIAGNSSDPDVGTGNYDAMAALFLKGDGKGKFTPVPRSGIHVKGEVRRIIKMPQQNMVILLKNNAPAVVYSIE